MSGLVRILCFCLNIVAAFALIYATVTFHNMGFALAAACFVIGAAACLILDSE